MQLVTPQTGAEGQLVRRVLVEEAVDIASELYLGVTLDRQLGKPVVMASVAGGMSIEEVAAENPDAIVRQPIDPHLGAQPFQLRAIVGGLGLSGGTAKQARKLIAALIRAFIETDASLAEINPLLVTGDGDVLALVSKPAYDPNAFAGGIDTETWRRLTTDPWRPLQNRAIAGQYPPGSIVKRSVSPSA